MSQFRSEEMTLCQLYLQSEAAYSCVSQLGELAIIQFKDLNGDKNAFQRRFVNEIRRCEEMERQIRYFEKELKKEKVSIPSMAYSNPPAPEPRDLIDLEAKLESLEGDLKEISNNIEIMERNQSELKEFRHVLKFADIIFTETGEFLETAQEVIQGGMEVEMASINEHGYRQEGIRLEFVTGVLLRERLEGFMRLLWYACHGTAFVKFADIYEQLTDPVTGTETNKVVFVVLFQGTQLRDRIKKICEGFRATLYPCPETSTERREMAHGVNTRLTDMIEVMVKSGEQRHRILIAAANNVSSWWIKVRKVKAIYLALDMFNTDQQNYVAEAWVPVNQLDTLQAILLKASENSRTSAPSLVHRLESKSKELPTYNRTNKFTQGFQAIIDAYGIASYREINPAPYTIITFPFLFAVMFGDAGHGFLMFLAALYLVLKERKLEETAKNSEIFGMFFSGRYIILLMSIFSIYTGFIYNDIFSKSVNLFGSSWTCKVYDDDTVTSHEVLQLDPNNTNNFTAWAGYPYPFGIDPVWQMSTNKIGFSSSYKKKLSIILGVVHMLAGLALSVVNHVNNRSVLNIIGEFIPQLLFLLSMFGYLVGLIIAKWVVYTPAISDKSPNLLIGLINMFLFKFPPEDNKDPSIAMWYPSQKETQIFLVLLAVICVPWMLLTKPLVLRYRNKRRRKPPTVMTIDVALEFGESSTDPEVDTSHQDKLDDEVELVVGSHDSMDSQDEEFDFNEELLHQGIHTIEFCLGCISHTASYLRLWALSLAHSQLSEVLWNMIMRMGLIMGPYYGALIIVNVFAFWAGATVAILLLMEGLSAFLHTLRLHWVEFQSKFYKGDGWSFEPLNFHKLLNDSGD